MIIFYYDKTFEGLLCAVFDAFKLKKMPDLLLTPQDVEPLLTEESYYIETITSKFERVQIALKKRLTKITLKQLMLVWLSELIDSDILIFKFICKFFKTPISIETDFADPDILMIRQIASKIMKERHHLMQFVRFKAIELDNDTKKEKIYFATVDPIYNALPLTINFFKDRFADQQWIIYDKRRHYGYYYNCQKVTKIFLNEQDDLIKNGHINQKHFTDDERFFQTMWYKYCKALTIKERLNPKLQRQFMPKRFWNDLPEMNRD